MGSHFHTAGVRMMKSRESQRSSGCFNNHTRKKAGWCEKRSRKWHGGLKIDLNRYETSDWMRSSDGLGEQ